MNSTELECQRSLFDLPADATYLNCAYQSPQLNRSTELATQALRRKSRPWSITTDDFFTPAETLRALFADLIDARPEDIAIVPSISYAMATAAACLPPLHVDPLPQPSQVQGPIHFEIEGLRRSGML